MLDIDRKNVIMDTIKALGRRGLKLILLLISLILAVIIFFGLSYRPDIDYEAHRYAMNCQRLHSLTNVVNKYKKSNSVYPSQDKFYSITSFNIDYTGNPFHYIKTKTGFEIFSLGKDQKFGGTGIDKDVFLPDCLKKFTKNEYNDSLNI